MQELILASGSRYRRGLLKRLGMDFAVVSPDIDEGPLAGERPRELAVRLARAKAAHIARTHASAVVIGSDQVASLDGRVLSKPGNRENARAQLLECSGKCLSFYTAVSVLSGSAEASHVDETWVSFRKLDPSEIDAYIEKEEPYDCAGSFKAEGLGIVLFESIKSDDPTGLIGLPLIWLSSALRELGYPLLLR